MNMKTELWTTEPISCTCEVMRGQEFCDAPTVAAYPAMSRGWMALCFKHSLKHPEATPTDELIQKGEAWI